MPAIFLPMDSLPFFEDRSKCAYGLKSSPCVEMLQSAFCPGRYPLNNGVPRQGQQGQEDGFVGQTLANEFGN